MGGYDSLVRAVLALEPPLFVFGGFAEDVLFNGRVARPHSDLDVLIYRDEVAARFDQFATLGFTEFEVWWESQPGLPLVYHAARDGIDLEPSVFERDGPDTWFVLQDLAGRFNRIYLPEDTFDYPPIPSDGIDWRIVSPLCLYQIRAAIETLGVFGSLREKDGAAQRILRTRFLGDLEESELLPRIVSLQADR
jgi:hypothetical protein